MVINLRKSITKKGERESINKIFFMPFGLHQLAIRNISHCFKKGSNYYVIRIIVGIIKVYHHLHSREYNRDTRIQRRFCLYATPITREHHLLMISPAESVREGETEEEEGRGRSHTGSACAGRPVIWFLTWTSR